jgi:sec-independent protein translocase protein TatB
MFGIAPSELMLLAIVALVVVGPKDLPRVMRVAGLWIGRARAMAGQLKSGLDEVVREAELADIEQRWKLENERILSEHLHPPQLAAGVEIAASEPASPLLP